MSGGILEFSIRTGKIVIDYTRCEPASKNTSTPSCGFACVKADRFYGRNVLKIENNRPVLAVLSNDAERLCNECLGCQHDCESYGTGCITVDLPLSGLDSYRKRQGGE